MAKDTAKIVEELKLCPDFSTFYEENKEHMAAQPLSEMLEALMTEKGLKKTEVIRRSEVSEIYAYQIFSGRRLPQRNKLICLALGMGLSVEETQSLLRCGGYSPLYVKLPFDSVVLYGIHKGLSVPELNDLLFEYGQDMLG